MRFPRSSGILLHITSLPNDYGIGDLGPAAFEFIDFLVASGQSIWQILPLCPPSHGNSPYSSYSAFAANPLLISPERLVQDGWLDDSWLRVTQSLTAGPTSEVNFDLAIEAKRPLLEAAFSEAASRLPNHTAFQLFCKQNGWWLNEFARFEAMINHFGGNNWTSWPNDIVRREPESLQKCDQELASQIEFSKFKQFLFDAQWNTVKAYANERGVCICGDMPIFVAHESVDVWSNQSLFSLNEDGTPTVVAGVPPDYFSETGQLWGNPLYRWDVMEDNGFAWWTARFRRSLQQFDLLRVDHFRGFEAYWEIPADAESAVSGTWKPGPLHKPFTAATNALGELPIWAEDLGEITQGVHDLRQQLDFPPMRVLQFGYANEHDDFHRPTTYPEHCVAYTGTHDNDTTMGWFADRQQHQDLPAEHDPLLRELNLNEDIHWQLIDLVLSSAASCAIIPLQDVLGLGTEARMNVPGEATGNWTWRSDRNALTDEISTRLQALSEAANRLAANPQVTA